MTAERRESDSMGEVTLPAQALYGASTARAIANFPIGGGRVPPPVIRALALIKRSAAAANRELGLIDTERAALIDRACAEIAAGGHADQFPIDVFQTGSGTSTNMNLNEVIANRCAQLAGKPLGGKDPVHPNDHVNRCQSSNDVFPSAIRVAAVTIANRELRPALEALRRELSTKAAAWDDVLKIARTHLMDAVPIRLGQEFAGYAAQLTQAQRRLDAAVEALRELPLGGTAVGTGINAHPRFAALAIAQINRLSGETFRAAENHCEAQAAQDAAAEASGLIKTIAISLSKIANDIRLLGSGPRCGLGELILPALQPGSSIMPGKVNPVVCEAVVQVAAQVVGNDAAIALAGFGGVGAILDLNVAMPLIARNLIDSLTILSGAARALAEKVVIGLEPDRERCRAMIERSLAMCTALAPVIGYDRAAAIAKRAFTEGKTVREVAVEMKVLSAAELERLLDPRAMTEPGASGGEG